MQRAAHRGCFPYPFHLVGRRALRRAAQLNSLSELAITKLDVLNDLEEIKVCTSYAYRGKELREFPRDPEVLAECVPVYTSFPGWKGDISEVKSYAGLPQSARDYLDKLVELTGCPVVLVSVGPRRDQTIQLANPFC